MLRFSATSTDPDIKTHPHLNPIAFDSFSTEAVVICAADGPRRYGKYWLVWVGDPAIQGRGLSTPKLQGVPAHTL